MIQPFISSPLQSYHSFKIILEPILTMASTSMSQDNRPIDNDENGTSGQNFSEVCKIWPTAKPKTCDKCGESYPSIIKFNAHRGTCKKHKCPQCDFRFPTEKELKAHVVTHRVRFMCDQCETEPFYSQATLDNHKKIVHGIAIKCPHCPRTFCRVDVRDQHVKNKHNAETVNKCKCGATYVHKWQLKRHEQDCVVSPIGSAKAVKRKYEELVQEHSLSQGNDTNAAAALSGMDVAVVALKAFDLVREATENKLNNCCMKCGTSFQDRESLKRHIRKKHPRWTGSLEPET